MKKSIIVLFIFLEFFLFPRSVSAQDVDCIGSSLAKYVASVFKNLGITDNYTNRFGNILFLSPSFNMTEPNFPALVEKLNSELNTLGYSLDNFYAIAGNAYNTPWGLIRDFVNNARKTSIGERKIILTEIGWYPHKTSNREMALEQLKNEINNFQKENVIGGLIFNVFNNNPQFADQSMTEFEINSVCSGDCYSAGVGANSATFYSSSDENFYNKAQANRMKYTLEIANNNTNRSFPNLMPGINSAHNKGIIPILRLGVGNSSGGFDNPLDLASFIQDLNNNLSSDVYVIIGPNEPLSECWATPNCECGSRFKQEPITISGPSDISVHFTVTREKDTGKKTEILPLPTPSGVQGTSTNKRNITGQSFEGEVNLLESKFPNFQIFQKTMSTALQRLLPYSLSQNLILPGDTTVYYRIFAQSKSQPDGDFDPSTKTECHQAPKGKFTIEADKWGRLAGAMRGFCSFLGINVCPAISNFQFQLEEPDYPCDVGSFGPGAQAAEVKNPPPKTENKNFKVQNAFIEIIETIEEIISNVIARITSTKERKEVQFLHHGELAAGHTTVENSEWLYGFLPQEVIQKVEPRDELKALEEGFRYQYSFSPVEANEHQGEYLELRKMRNAYLMFRCALSPSGSGYAEADPLYKSCNPNDFDEENKRLIKPIPKPPNLLPGCHWDASAGCDYYDCMIGERLADGTICSRSCDLDPICESDLCTINKLYTKPFLEDGTYCPNKQCHPGECYRIHFSHPSSYYYPDYDLPKNGPPWGPFYTKNPDVCMRGDGMGCNPDCCQGSEVREYDK